MVYHSSEDQELIRKLTDITLTNLQDENFGVKELSIQSGLSRISLSRKLHSISNKTPSQFIRETRLLKAHQMLQNEQVTASEAAYKTGFNSPAYFSTCFREYFGYPPGAVIKGNLGTEEEEKGLSSTSKDKFRNVHARDFYFAAMVILLIAFSGYVAYNIVKKRSGHSTSTGSIKYEKSIAVMPFKNLSSSIENQYFIDGIMEEIFTDLSKIHDLRVVSRTSVAQYLEKPMLASEIGKKLKVQYIVEGSGQKYGSSLLLRVQLIETSKDRHIWAKSYSQEIREPDDIFKIQREVAQSIANELDAKITPKELKIIEKTPTQSIMAHDLYLRGVNELSKYGIGSTNLEAIKRAENLFRDAIRYDSAYSSAYLGLAGVYWKKLDFEISSSRDYIINAYLDSMLSCTNIAISLDDQNAEAYYIRGGYYIAKGNESEALKDWNKAIMLDPNNPDAYWGKGWVYTTHDLVRSLENFEKVASLSHGGNLPEVLTQIGEDYYIAGFPDYGNKYLTEALELDGDSVKYLDTYIYFSAENQGEYAKAVRYLERRFSSDSTNDRILLRLAFYNSMDGRYNESLKYYNKYFSRLRNKIQITTSWEKLMMEYHYGYVNMQVGNSIESERYYKKALADYDRTAALVSEHTKRIYIYRLAALYAGNGKIDKAFQKLRLLDKERCFTLRDLTLLKNDPLFNGIRNEPEFQKFLRNVESRYKAEHQRVGKWIEENEKR